MTATGARRVRTGSKAAEQRKEKPNYESMLALWEANEKKMLKAAAEMKAIEKEMFEAMVQFGDTHASTATVEAKIVTPVSRSSTEIDKVKYKKAVGEKAFMESVTISVTAAKKHLSEKELGLISTKVPGKEKPEELKISHVKK